MSAFTSSTVVSWSGVSWNGNASSSSRCQLARFPPVPGGGWVGGLGNGNGAPGPAGRGGARPKGEPLGGVGGGVQLNRPGGILAAGGGGGFFPFPPVGPAEPVEMRLFA